MNAACAAACPAEAGRVSAPAKVEEWTSMLDRDISLQDLTYRNGEYWSKNAKCSLGIAEYARFECHL
jgi:hypothetical protein